MLVKTISKIVNTVFSKPPMCSAVIAAAGSSQRMGGEDKLYADICGAPVLAHTLLVFQNCSCIHEIIVVASLDKLGPAAELCEKHGISKAAGIITGGPTRIESVLNGIYAVSKRARLIAIHDGARPCVSEDIIRDTVEKAARYHAAAPGVPAVSTLKNVKNGVIAGTVDREGIFEIQTPQVFDADLIKCALTNAARNSIEITDDCMAAELIGAPVHITEGSPLNIKLTRPEDFILAEATVRSVYNTQCTMYNLQCTDRDETDSRRRL